MEYSDLIVQKDGSVMTVVLNRPKALNTLSIRLLQEIKHLSSIFHSHDRASIHMDADQFMLTTYTQDHREGLAAFLERRKPEFKGN